MNPEAKRLWVEALRSGRFKQGQGFLRREDKFCCLGVACERLSNELDLLVDHDSDPSGNTFNYNGTSTILPDVVAEHLGVSGEEENVLIDMNDSGKSFSEIADWIEANL